MAPFVPLRGRDPANREQYSRTQKRVLRGCADQFALLLENARLDRVAEQKKCGAGCKPAADCQSAIRAKLGLFPLSYPISTCRRQSSSPTPAALPSPQPER